MTRLKRWISKLLQYFLQGLLVMAPVTVTIILIIWLFNWLDNLLPIYINVSGNASKPLFLPGLGIFLVVVTMVLVGYLSSLFVVTRVISFFDNLLEKTPGIKLIYSFVKDFSEAVVGKKRKFQKTVLVNAYQPDVWQLGFVTNEELERFGLDEFVTVYIPSSYAVAGTLFFVKKDRVRLLPDVSGPEAYKFAISGGIVEVEDVK